MPADSERLVELRAVSKDYRGLRPLRVSNLELHAGQSVALLGFDQVTAELLVNLVTGAILPDAGEVIVMGRSTALDIPTPTTGWKRSTSSVSVSERAVLLDQLTAEQNLAMPLSLELDEPPDDVRARVNRLADEVGIDAEACRPIARSTPARAPARAARPRARARSARAAGGASERALSPTTLPRSRPISPASSPADASRRSSSPPTRRSRAPSLSRCSHFSRRPVN